MPRFASLALALVATPALAAAAWAEPLAVVPPLAVAASPSPKPNMRPRPKPRPKPRSSVVTRFGGVRYDPKWSALVLGFSGPVPGYNFLAAGPGEVTLGFPKTALAPGLMADHALGGNPVLRHWSFERDGSGVKLTLGLRANGHAVVSYDATRHALLLFPQVATTVKVGGGAIATILGTASYDRSTDALLIPYYGQAPTASLVQADQATWYVDIRGAGQRPAGVQLGTVPGHPLLESWLLAPLPAGRGVRLALVMAYPGNVNVRVDTTGERLIISPRLRAPGAPPHLPLPSPRPIGAKP